MKNIYTGARWSGAEWANMQQTVAIIGLGGIGSWLTLSLSRIGHYLVLFDGDRVDETNVGGGQMYRNKDISSYKTSAITAICREFGCINVIETIPEFYTEGTDYTCDITICGLDNMQARKTVFNKWKNRKEGLFMDGRLLLENMEIFTILAQDQSAIEEYEKKYLFDDSEVADLDCTTKQCTFSAMTIAGLMTATLCNYLTNLKLGEMFRTIPFYQRMFLPIFENKIQENVGAKAIIQ